ncbi:hypothetical protein HYT02_00925 [Candidatus Gottesmanbacteria bacterium]|nr:hypothetical protein [Candidatus Gottesmanbacteria bacterium]
MTEDQPQTLADIKISDLSFYPEIIEVFDKTGILHRLSEYQQPAEHSPETLEFYSRVSLQVCENITSSDNPVVKNNLYDMSATLLLKGIFTPNQFLQIAKTYLSSSK